MERFICKWLHTRLLLNVCPAAWQGYDIIPVGRAGLLPGIQRLLRLLERWAKGERQSDRGHASGATRDAMVCYSRSDFMVLWRSGR